jgi:nucleoside-diphosphate-sugar epimerase
MRVFVTGASGFVGSAVVKELLGAGHAVVGLARSDANAAALTAVGAQPHQGSLEDVEALRAGAAAADGVIHCAFNHDFSKFVENSEMDRRAIQAMGEALEGSGRPLIVTSGMALLAPGKVSTEDDTRDPSTSRFPRVSEETGESFAARGVRAMTMRLPPSVHGDGDHGFVPQLIRIAREQGASAYIGEGANRWPAVHRLDAARLYRLALEKGQAGARYHAVGDDGLPFREIARAIADGLGVPLISVAQADAEKHFGWFAMFAGIDAPTSAAKTVAVLDWRPEQVGLIADLQKGTYFGPP